MIMRRAVISMQMTEGDFQCSLVILEVIPFVLFFLTILPLLFCQGISIDEVLNWSQC